MDFAEASVVDNLLIAEVDDEIGANVVEDDMLVVAPDGNTDISWLIAIQEETNWLKNLTRRFLLVTGEVGVALNGGTTDIVNGRVDEQLAFLFWWVEGPSIGAAPPVSSYWLIGAVDGVDLKYFCPPCMYLLSRRPSRAESLINFSNHSMMRFKP